MTRPLEAAGKAALWPLLDMLVSGGDRRLLLDPASGLNPYGCGPQPRAAIPFGSCTSSAMSARGLDAATATFGELCRSASIEADADKWFADVRRRLRGALELGQDVEIAFTPSGTDAEMLALALTAGVDASVRNIVVGPSEVGGGTRLAAGCRHYDTRAPQCEQVQIGEPICPDLVARTHVECVDIRAADGSMLEEHEIDAEVCRQVERAHAQGAVALVHIVAHSKTGMHAPSLACAAQLAACRNVVILVDAAQGRFSRRGLREVLDKGYLVMFTGSKFYGGPPFSGALLIPKAFYAQRSKPLAFSEGFAAYFTRAEMPESWTEVRACLPAHPNLGTLLRWSAALAQIDAYYDVPGDARLAVLRYFEREAPRLLGASSRIRMSPVFPPLHSASADRLLESKTTVFSFWVRGAGDALLGDAELRALHRQLNVDVAASVEPSQRKVAARQFHLGQPVRLGADNYVLRIALGGELIVRVATDLSLGATLEARLLWLGYQLIGLREKIELLAPLHGSVAA